MSDQPLTYIPAIQSQIGLALRMALENGMHTEMRSKQVGEALSQRCRKVWWTVCILDRQMSSLMGVPMAIADESISAELPTFAGQPQRSTAMDVQIKLSRVLAQILNSKASATTPYLNCSANGLQLFMARKVDWTNNSSPPQKRL